jgi:hypothetical protein
MALANSLTGYMSGLGLERRARPIKQLGEYLLEKESSSEETPKKHKQAHESGSGKFSKKAADIETSAEVADENGGEVEE